MPPAPTTLFFSLLLANTFLFFSFLQLRKEKGLTYGAYSALRGGHQNSSSWVYAYSSFSMQKMKEAVPIMRSIFDKFVEEGISKDEFATKKSNFEKSMKIRMNSTASLLNSTHNNVLNGSKINFKKISETANTLTLEEVNRAIRTHLYKKPVVHVLCGDFENNKIIM